MGKDLTLIQDQKTTIAVGAKTRDDLKAYAKRRGLQLQQASDDVINRGLRLREIGALLIDSTKVTDITAYSDTKHQYPVITIYIAGKNEPYKVYGRTLEEVKEILL